jgi:Kef-type K+ transport system membrane component KefB/nucleotide-binding universal stress UspA family protein
MADPHAPAARAADKFGQTSRGRTIAIYVVFVAALLVAFKFVFTAGDRIAAPRPAAGAPAAAPKAAGSEGVVWRLLLASAVIILVARVLGGLCRRINQPQVVGEIAAGIVLGPSLLGAIWPKASTAIFPSEVLPYIDVLAQIGLIFFMFLIGLELDLRLIRGRGHAAIVVSHASIIVPFVLGGLLALLLFPVLGSPQGRFGPFALFMGAAMSITAFPVLARILTERGLYKTRLGAVTLTCAAVDDVTAWCILAVVVTVAANRGPLGSLRTVLLAGVFIAFMVLVIRPLLGRLAARHEEHGKLGAGLLSLLFAGILLSALATDRIGIHAIFGAFLFGTIMPQRGELIVELVNKLEDFAVLYLLPLFFAFSGLRTDVTRIGLDPQLWSFLGLTLLVAVAGKWGGSTLAARLTGLDWRESTALGVLMNCRGLTELVILNIGLDLGVIPPTLFAMLVIMALVTTIMTTPALSLAYPTRVLDQMVRDEVGDPDEEGEAPPWRVLVSIANSQTAPSLVDAALRLASGRERAEIVLLRVVEPGGSAYRAGVSRQETIVERANRRLRPLVQRVEDAGVEAIPLVLASRDVGATIAKVTTDRDINLVLIGYHRSVFGRRLLGGIVGDVLRSAEADVAVLVDPSTRGVTLSEGDTIVVPYGGGFHEDVGIDLAVRLAAGSGASISLVGAPDESSVNSLSERAPANYESTGVWVTPVPVEGDIEAGLVEASVQADLVVLGVSDRWVNDQGSVGPMREAAAARAAGPVLIVRRHGQPGARRPRFLRPKREWLEEAQIATRMEV